MIQSAFIVDCVRTAGGRQNGRISHWHPVDLGAVIIDELVRRVNIDPNLIDDIIVGCVSQIGAQAGNIGRNIVLASNLPENIPGTTCDRQCGSSQQAVHFAAQAVMSGIQDVVIAAGVESMSMVPIGSNITDGMKQNHGNPQSKLILKKYNNKFFSQFEGAEITAKRFEISREEMDKFAYNSHKKAIDATLSGKFKNEIFPINGIDKKTGKNVIHDVDEGIRFKNLNIDKLKTLPTLRKNGRISAGTSSQICDGSAAVLICNEKGLEKTGLRPRAKIISMALAATDPVMMLYGPIPATKKALKNIHLTINDIDIYEINEAFASVPLAQIKEMKADINKLNVCGGAIALGHPLGATGVRILTTLVNELERKKESKFGIQAICEGGGTANAMIIEKINIATNILDKNKKLYSKL